MHYRHSFRVFLAVTLLMALALFGAPQIGPARTAQAAAQPTGVATVDPTIDPHDGLPKRNGTNKHLKDFTGKEPAGTTIVTDDICTQPPVQSVKDHASMSDTELAAYGLEARPKRNPKQGDAAYQTLLDAWRVRVQHMQARSCTFVTSQNKSSWDTPMGSTYWDGWGEYDYTNQSQTQGSMFLGGQGGFTLVCAHDNGVYVTNGVSYNSVWLGDGGKDRGQMLQAGSQTEEVYTSGSYTFYYSLFWENVPSNSMQYILPPAGHAINCGDYIFVSLAYNCFQVQDQTNGWYTASTCWGPTPDYNSFEAILERPQINKVVYPLVATYTIGFNSMQCLDRYANYEAFYNVGSTGDWLMWDRNPGLDYRLATHGAINWDGSDHVSNYWGEYYQYPR